MSFNDISSNSENSLRAYARAIEISASNLSQSTTKGGKRLVVSFDTMLSNASNSRSSNGTTNYQEAPSVKTRVTIDFSQGKLTKSGSMDLALKGQGFFMLSNDGGKNFIYTRNGNFEIRNGFVVDKSGRQLYGYKLNSSGIPDKSKLIPIRTYSPSTAGWQYKGTKGILVDDYEASKNEGKSGNPVFQAALINFNNKATLVQEDDTTFSQHSKFAMQLNPSIPGENGMALAHSGMLEEANISTIQETLNSSAYEKGMSAQLTIISTINKIIQSLIQQLGNS